MQRARPDDLLWLDRSVACLNASEGLLASVGIDAALLDRLVYARDLLTASERVTLGTALRSLHEQNESSVVDVRTKCAVIVLRNWQFSGSVGRSRPKTRRQASNRTIPGAKRSSSAESHPAALFETALQTSNARKPTAASDAANSHASVLPSSSLVSAAATEAIPQLGLTSTVVNAQTGPNGDRNVRGADHDAPRVSGATMTSLTTSTAVRPETQAAPASGGVASLADPAGTKTDNDPWKFPEDLDPRKVPMQKLPQYVEMVMSSKPHKILYGLKMIGKVLARRGVVAEGDPIVTIFDTPKLVQRHFLLLPHSEESIVYQALSNIGDLCRGGALTSLRLARECGFVPSVFGLLDSGTPGIVNEALKTIWCFIGCHPEADGGYRVLRETLHPAQMWESLLDVVDPSLSDESHRLLAVILAGLSGAPKPKRVVDYALPLLARAVVLGVKADADVNAVRDGLRGLDWLCTDVDVVTRVCGANVLHSVMAHLRSHDVFTQRDAAHLLRAMAGVGLKQHYRVLVDHGILPSCAALLATSDEHLHVCACSILAPLCIGPGTPYLDQMLSMGLIALVAKEIKNKTTASENAAHVFLAAVLHGDRRQLREITQLGGVDALCDSLDRAVASAQRASETESEVIAMNVTAPLEAIRRLLSVRDGRSRIPSISRLRSALDNAAKDLPETADMVAEIIDDYLSS